MQGTEQINENASVNILSAKDIDYDYYKKEETKFSFNLQGAIVGTLITGNPLGAVAGGVEKDKNTTIRESLLMKQ